jgi:hypothetical protein
MDFGNRQTELHAACREEREKILRELEEAKAAKLHSPLYHARYDFKVYLEVKFYSYVFFT